MNTSHNAHDPEGNEREYALLETQLSSYFGAQPDDRAWERAHEFYLNLFADKGFSDIQDQQPVPLSELEAACR